MFAALVCSLIVVACGDSSTTTAEVLSKAQMIKQGDAICRAAYDERQEVIERLSEDPKAFVEMTKADQEEIMVSEMLPTFQRAAEQLRTLTPRPADRQEVGALIDEMEAAVMRSRQDPSSLVNGSEVQFGNAERLGREYGFEVCGRS